MLLSLALLSAAPAPAHLTVRFSAPPEVHFNRRGDSTLTVMAGKMSRTLKLGGVPDPADPQNIFVRLSDVALGFSGRFSGPVNLKAHLFLCGAQSGVCTVEEHSAQLQVKPGQRLTLNWRVGEENR